VRTALLRRNEKLDAIGEKQETYFVVISNGTEGEETGHLGGKLAFRLRSASKISGSAHIHDEHYGQLAFLGEFLHKGAAHSRSDVPIDRANFVARLIFAHVFKVHSASFENAVVISGERGFDQTAGFDLQRSDFLENFGCLLSPFVIPSGSRGCGRSRGAGRHHGTGSPAKIRSTMVSLVTASASAS
jgi:hypothetical protein